MLLRLAVCAAVIAAFLGSCSNGERPSGRPETPRSTPPAPDLRLVFMTDLEGYLEPCGCRSTSLGGIDRAAARLAALRNDGLPTAVLAVGDLFFESGADHRRDDQDARRQELWKAEALTDILGEQGLVLAVNGSGDLRYGKAPLAALVERARFPIHGVVPEASGPAQDQKLITVGKTKVGLWFRSATRDTWTVRELAQAATAAASDLRRRGAATVVALTVLPPRDERRLAESAGGVDFWVAAGRDREDPSPPERIGDGFLLTGGRHGRGLLVLEPSVRRPGAGFSDHSAWTRTATAQANERRARILAQRIAAWEQDPDVDPGQLAQQKARLAALRAPVADTAARTAPNAFAARYLPLPESAPRDPSTRARLVAYDRKVNRHNRAAFADRKPPAASPGMAVYVGSERCNGCHAAAYAWWQGHPHGTAYDTLRDRNKEYNLSCVGCHVTGYEQPGGATVTHNDGLIHVGCEACHGPGSLHLSDPERIVAAPGEGVCVECHNAEHSDRFEFQGYRAQLLVPGHGLPDPEVPK